MFCFIYIADFNWYSTFVLVLYINLCVITVYVTETCLILCYMLHAVFACVNICCVSMNMFVCVSVCTSVCVSMCTYVNLYTV